MAIRNSTLQLKARVTGSSGVNAVPHMAQPCASTSAAVAHTTASATGRSKRRRRAGAFIVGSVEIDQQEEGDPEPADEVPVEGAHLEARPAVPSRTRAALAHR